MALEQVEIQIAANTANAEAGLKKVQQEANKMGTSLENAGKSVVAAKGSIDRVGQSSNTAGYAMTNLTRVVQDAPFGFIAIQNNISPLIESFTRLKSETGSTGGAIRALLGSLTGGAGFLTLLNLGISAITMFSMSMRSSKNATDEATEAIDKQITSMKELIGLQNRFYTDPKIKEASEMLGTRQDQAVDATIRDRIANQELTKARERYNQVVLNGNKKQLDDAKAQLDLMTAQKQRTFEQLQTAELNLRISEEARKTLERQTLEVEGQTEKVKGLTNTEKERLNILTKIRNMKAETLKIDVQSMFRDSEAWEKRRKQTLTHLRSNIPQLQTSMIPETGLIDTQKQVAEALRNDPNIITAKTSYQILTSSMTDALVSQFGIAWGKIFDQANSLLEMFIDNVSRQIQMLAAQEIGTSLFGWITGLFGAGTGGAVGGLIGADRSTTQTINLQVDGDTIMSAVVEPRLGATINRQRRTRRMM